jgi:hypothetical protein
MMQGLFINETLHQLKYVVKHKNREKYQTDGNNLNPQSNLTVEGVGAKQNPGPSIFRVDDFAWCQPTKKLEVKRINADESKQRPSEYSLEQVQLLNLLGSRAPEDKTGINYGWPALQETFVKDPIKALKINKAENNNAILALAMNLDEEERVFNEKYEGYSANTQVFDKKNSFYGYDKLDAYGDGAKNVIDFGGLLKTLLSRDGTGEDEGKLGIFFLVRNTLRSGGSEKIKGESRATLDYIKELVPAARRLKNTGGGMQGPEQAHIYSHQHATFNPYTMSEFLQQWQDSTGEPFSEYITRHEELSHLR